MKKLCSLIYSLLLFPALAKADRFDATQSPFDWSVLVFNSDETARLDSKNESYTYKDHMMNVLLDQGIKNTKENVTCRFSLDKGMDIAPGLGSTRYIERFWINCDVKGVRVSMNAVSCAYNSSKPEYDLDSAGPLFESTDGRLSINVTCRTKKTALERE